VNRENEFSIQVTMTPEQARVVNDALDLFSRLHIGQFDQLKEQFWGRLPDRDTVLKLEYHLHEARVICFPELSDHRGHSHSMSSCPTEAGKVAWDIHQVIRHTESSTSRCSYLIPIRDLLLRQLRSLIVWRTCSLLRFVIVDQSLHHHV